MPKALYCFGFVSGGCVDDTAVAFQGYDDSDVNYSHRLDRGMYFISGTASTKFKIQVRIIVESSNHCPKAHVTDNKHSIVLLDAVLLKYEDTVSV